MARAVPTPRKAKARPLGKATAPEAKGSEYRKLTRMASPARATMRAELQETASRRAERPTPLAALLKGRAPCLRPNDSSKEKRARARVSAQSVRAETREVRPFVTALRRGYRAGGIKAVCRGPL